MTVLFHDPIFLEHRTGAHPETPERLRAIARRLESAGLAARCRAGQIQPLAVEDVAQLHAPEMVEQVRSLADRGGGWIDSDTVVSPASFRVALAAAGAAASAVDAVVAGPDRNALCLIRPPGHHATPATSMGFCLFNNVALAARRARTRHGLDRILIVDFDVHHGNGTQDIFYRDPDVHFVSIHRYGRGFYPGTGAADETGAGPGLGATLNVPLRYGVSRADYRAAATAAIEGAADRFRPQLVLVSAGFDAHRLDPVGDLGLEVEDYGWLTELLLAAARAHCDGRLVSCLEGGYHHEATAEGVAVHLAALLDHA